jgi:hypothetical protein
MSSFKHRLLWRAAPVGAASAAVGFFLCRLYLAALQTYAGPSPAGGGGVGVQGPLVFGLAGFLLTAAVESVRRERKAAEPLSR